MEQHLVIEAERLSEEIEKLATFSETPGPAVTRILYSKADNAARAWLRGLMRDSDLTIHEDPIGNLYARWEGSDPSLPAVSTGSHIDAIPYSGKYDGTVGVLGGLEAIRALKRAKFEPKRSIELILFTAEEPTRFGIGCLGSRAMAGLLNEEGLLALSDGEGNQLDDLRRSAGFSGGLEEIKLSAERYHAFVELHIEQGARLELLKKEIGIVTSIAAPATLRVVIQGDGGHAGAVLMPGRRDALAASSEIVLAVERAAKESPSDDAVATVGLLKVYPGAVNSIPSEVTMEIDIRDTVLETRDQMVEQIQTEIASICQKRLVTPHVTVLNADRPATSNDTVISAIIQAVRTANASYEKLVSRAYHDTLFMAQLCPTAMIFIPSENGYSHRPEEYSSPKEIERGVLTLAHTLANLSKA